MYRKILVANRGEVADGVFPTGREASARMVAVLAYEGGQGGRRPHAAVDAYVDGCRYTRGGSLERPVGAPDRRLFYGQSEGR